MIRLNSLVNEKINHPITVYKRGTRGEVFVKYNSLSDFIDKELKARGVYKSKTQEWLYFKTHLSNHLKGLTKSITVFHLNYMAVIKFNK
jgi:hypothetical protein